MIWQKLGYKGRYVAFKDGGTLNSAVMGKHVSIGVGDMSDLLGKEQLLKPIVAASAQRLPGAPGIPKFREIGYDIVEGNFRGFVARKEIPQQVRAFYDQVYARVMDDPRWTKFLADAPAAERRRDGAPKQGKRGKGRSADARGGTAQARGEIALRRRAVKIRKLRRVLR